MFPSRELKIVPLGWGSGVSSEAGICANMGLGEGLLPGRVEGGVGSMAGEPRPPVEDAPSWPQPPPSGSRGASQPPPASPNLTGSAWTGL